MVSSRLVVLAIVSQNSSQLSFTAALPKKAYATLPASRFTGDATGRCAGPDFITDAV